MSAWAANGLRLKTKIYPSARLSSHPVLIVVLHGDLPRPSYHYEFAHEAAVKMDDVVIAALLRPGYVDDTGDRSGGEQGLTTGDNYTPEVVDAVAQAVELLKAKFHPVRTVLAGHSGGAAITGNVLGRWPSEVDAAFMVSCPCDLAAWRKHMLQMQNDPIWLRPVKSLSPIDLAFKVPRSVRVRLLVGSEERCPALKKSSGKPPREAMVPSKCVKSLEKRILVHWDSGKSYSEDAT